MRKYISLILVLVMAASFFACRQDDASDPSDDPQAESSADTQVSEEVSIDIMESAEKIISALDYTNPGKMGDVDGPAFAVYSIKGFTGASVKLDIENMEISTVLDDGRYINGYTFLGIDVFEGEWWANCVDAGLCWSGKTGGWHIFYNMYEPLNEDTYTWYESSKKLPKNDVYTLTLTITEDNYAKITVEGTKTNFKDSVVLEVKGAKADGSNTAFLFNTALDYPANTKLDVNGNPSENWKDITLGNTDKGLYLKSFHAYELTLYKGEEAVKWENSQNSAVGIWPDLSVGFDYAPTTVGVFDGTEYYIDLDMNRE